MRKILGIDPGLNATGWGLIEVRGQILSHCAHGIIRVPKGDLPLRLKHIFTALGEVIIEHQPTEAVVEIVFVNVNPQSTLLLGQARGTAVCAAVARDLPVAEYTALQIKQAVVGHGKAAKEQVQAMVTRILKLKSEPPTDAADALACAITHAHQKSALSASLQESTLQQQLTDKLGRSLKIRGGRFV